MKQNSIKENLGLNTNFVQKDFCMEKNCGPKKNLGQNFVYFGFWSKTNFEYQKKNLVQKKLWGPKKNLSLKKI